MISLASLTIFVVPTVYTLFARKRVPGEITTAESDEVEPIAHGLPPQPAQHGAD